MTLNDQEKRLAIFERDHWTCRNCWHPIRSGQPQLAHRIPQRKNNIKKYGKAVIHHPMNLMSVCSLDCNNRIQINSPAVQQALADLIQERIQEEKENCHD